MKTRKSEADDDTFKLIMRNKEQLLDINEPLRFIFSHSALREGWDSPNVFQICTLNETKPAGQELKISENRKIKCGQAHYKEFDDVKYRQVATVSELD